ncbi:MAG: aromatic amino acid transaminase [Thiolinea sp.]
MSVAGDPVFNRSMLEIVFGNDYPKDRLYAMQTPGGSGALRVLAELIGRHRPDSHIWLSTPTWPNHNALLNVAGMPISTYPYFDYSSNSVDFPAMKARLAELGPKDVVVLHGCCHNPTGANLSPQQWDEVAELARERGFFPLVDMAYQGFGDDLDTDAYSVRKLMTTVDEMAVAVSCSKNFGIYRDRVGCAMLMGKNAGEAETAFRQLQTVARSIYSMPPDHGAAVVSIIWNDPELRQGWYDELKAITGRMLNLRQLLAAALRETTGSHRFDFLADHRGMFSLLGITEAEVLKLRERYGIYVVNDGRMNIAGLQEPRVEELARAIADVIG